MSALEKRRSSAVSTAASWPNTGCARSSPGGSSRQAMAMCRHGGALRSRWFRSLTAPGSDARSASSSARTQGRPPRLECAEQEGGAGIRLAESGLAAAQRFDQGRFRLPGRRTQGRRRGRPGRRRRRGSPRRPARPGRRRPGRHPRATRFCRSRPAPSGQWRVGAWARTRRVSSGRSQ